MKVKDFDFGEIVRLKSGGPDMTVNSYVMADEWMVVCCWFTDRNHQSASFHPNAIVKTTADTTGMLLQAPADKEG